MRSSDTHQNIKSRLLRRQISSVVQAYFDRNIQDIHRTAARMAGTSGLERYKDNLCERILPLVMQGISDISDKITITKMVRAEVRKRIKSLEDTYKGVLVMANSMSKEEMVLRLVRIAKKCYDNEDVETAERITKVALSLDGTDDGTLGATPPHFSMDNGMQLNQLTNGGGQEVAPAEGEPSSKEDEIGKYDPHRKPAPNMYDVQLLRVQAYSASEAQAIVEKFVEWARKNGQPRMSVGTITKCRDAEDDDSK